jgi:hypothetical protein
MAVLIPTLYVLKDPKGSVNGLGRKRHVFAKKSQAITAWREGGLRYKKSADVVKVSFESKTDFVNFIKDCMGDKND